MPQAVEITTFRLSEDLTIDDFIAANEDIDPWLQNQPGFVSRHICERDDGFVVDMLVWDSAEAGHRAAAGVTTEMAASPVHASIDQSSVTWTISVARHIVDRLSVP
ncbi:hypothetical protein QP162_22345 [Sphingomonas aurantiaca]|uniref:antibiotic biosynthesis monooxygenase family protein n=1 Tax=Sphingomonas aurantiaca TaxID=185949 RepID=UPI002FE06942